jgi:DNA repair exonuclease SbcCD nuclease subunit
MAAQQAPAFEKGKLYDLPIIDIKPISGIFKERQPHEPKTELEIVKGTVKNLNAMKTRISSLELAALDGEEKTRLTGEIDQLSQELTDRLNEIISRLQPRQLA